MAASITKIVKTELLPLVLRCELDRVVLSECNLRRAHLASEDLGPYKLDLGSEVLLAEIRDSMLFVLVRLNAKSEAESGQTLFDVDLGYELQFRYQGAKPKDQEIEQFIKTTPLFLAWPYLRESLQSLCSRMELSPPPLPLLKSIPVSATVAKKKKAR